MAKIKDSVHGTFNPAAALKEAPYIKARAGEPGAGAPGLFKRGLADSAGVLVAPEQLAGNESLVHRPGSRGPRACLPQQSSRR